MSGVETVLGLVLGAYPVVILALQQYKEAKKNVVAWWRFERHYTNAWDALELERIILEQQLEKLLLP
jgi:hypothetical protein